MVITDPNIIAMDSARFAAALESIREKRAAMPRIMPSALPSNVAQINVHGLLMPAVPQNYKDWGVDVTGYQDIADAVMAAMEDPRTDTIFMHFDSGGGYVKGVDVAADAIALAATQKRVIAYVDGTAASAAYWLASCANEIQATKLSELGGVGVYTTLYDDSKMMDRIGIRAIVIRSGAMKGVGEDAVTDEQVAAEMQIVTDIHAQFVDSVSRGRGIPLALAQALANGQTWLAPRAVEVRIADSITKAPVTGGTQGDESMAKTESDWVAELALAKAETDRAIKTAADADVKHKAELEASVKTAAENSVTAERERTAALVSAFQHDPEFCAKAIKDGLSVEQAKAAHYDVLAARGGGGEAKEFVAKREGGAGIPTTWAEAVEHIKARDKVGGDKAADWLFANTTTRP